MKSWYEVTAGTLMVGALLGFLAASICACGSDTKEAKRAEAHQILGSARDYLRVQRDKTKRLPAKLSESAAPGEFDGQYFRVLDRVYEGQWPQQHDAPVFSDTPSAIVAAPVNPDDGWGVMYFDWNRDRKFVEWYDEEPAFVKSSSDKSEGASQ